MSTTLENTVLISNEILDLSSTSNFAGYDPFDFLNSSFVSVTKLDKIGLFRLAWLQLGKRFPINLRPMVGVPMTRNAKGVGLFILGLVQDFKRTSKQVYLDEAQGLGNWLLENRSGGEWQAHPCWGYHFDWQARAFFVPAGKPNIITTCYVARALYDLGKALGDEAMVAIALHAAYFISKRLYSEVGGRRFFAYIPGETAFVHNASLWGSAWCAFAGTELGDQALVAQALDVARQSVGEQSATGSWAYGSLHHHQFIDGFHTGFNLEALHMIRKAVATEEFDSCIARGFCYYKANFFTADGTAKYYNNNVYPIDMHSFAQAVFTLIEVGGKEEDLQLCELVVQRGIDLMYQPDRKSFIYQRTRWLTNRINYIRWTQAWAYASLAFYNRYRAESEHAKN